MRGESRGGNDTIIGGDAPFNTIYGDTLFMHDNSRGGNDKLTGAGDRNTISGEPDELIRRQLQELALQVPHVVVAVSPEGEVILRSNVSADVLRRADIAPCLPRFASALLRAARNRQALTSQPATGCTGPLP